LLLWGKNLLRPPSPFLLLLLMLLLLFPYSFRSYLDKRQEKLRTEAAEASACTGYAGPTRHFTEEMEVDSNSNQSLGVGGAGGDAEGGKEGKEGKDHGQHLPAKRCRLTDTMKSMVGELVLLSNECCRLKNEKVSIRQLYISRFRMN
jgi:Ubinuclein conserved middle domain